MIEIISKICAVVLIGTISIVAIFVANMPKDPRREWDCKKEDGKIYWFKKK